jgi:hypothetical protein
MISEGRDKPMTFPESEGEGTDGKGSPGIIEEKNREAETAQAENSAFDLDGTIPTVRDRRGCSMIRSRERPAPEPMATTATAPAAAASSTTGRRAIGNRQAGADATETAVAIRTLVMAWNPRP